MYWFMILLAFPLSTALEGVEVVFHMAAPNSSINNYKLHYSVNVQGNLVHFVPLSFDFQFPLFLYQHLLVGTKNVIDACVELKVKRLIYTSSPSVVSDGVHPIFNGDESLPYAAQVFDSF